MSINVGSDTAELWDWMGRDRALIPHLRAVPTSVAGDKLGAEYMIMAAIASLPVVARSVCNYLTVRAKTRGSTLTMHITNESGRVTKIDVDRTTDAVEFARLLLTAADEPGEEDNAITEA